LVGNQTTVVVLPAEDLAKHALSERDGGLMISTERLEEMRQAELRVVQYPGQHHGVKRVSEELAEALGELIELRVDPNNPAWRRMQYEAVAAATRGFTVEHSPEMIALTVEEEGVSPQLELWGEQ
jgi:hypothetical protein